MHICLLPIKNFSLPQILNNVTNFFAGVYTSYIGVIVRDESYHGNDPPVSNPIVDTNFTNWLNKLMVIIFCTFSGCPKNGNFAIFSSCLIFTTIIPIERFSMREMDCALSNFEIVCLIQEEICVLKRK